MFMIFFDSWCRTISRSPAMLGFVVSEVWETTKSQITVLAEMPKKCPHLTSRAACLSPNLDFYDALLSSTSVPGDVFSKPTGPPKATLTPPPRFYS